MWTRSSGQTGSRRRHAVLGAAACFTSLTGCHTQPTTSPLASSQAALTCDPASPFCGPDLSLEVRAETRDPAALELQLALALAEGGYFASLVTQGGAPAWVEVQGTSPGVVLRPASCSQGERVGQAYIRLPFQVDTVACHEGCAVDLELHGRSCREPGMCQDLNQAVHIHLKTSGRPGAPLSIEWR